MDDYYYEDEVMAMIDNTEGPYFQKMDLLRNRKDLQIADVEEFIMNLWAKPPGAFDYRYIWTLWTEEQEEINSNGW